MLKKYFYVLDIRESAGFCSEINNILYAIYFFEHHNSKFRIISKGWVSTYEKGWNDYFKSLKSNHKIFSFRFFLVLLFISLIEFLPINKYTLNKKGVLFKYSFIFLYTCLLKLYNKNCIVRYNKNFEKMRKYVLENRKDNKFQFITDINNILNNIWVFNDETQILINNYLIKSRLRNLLNGEEFIAIHIRRGDKIKSNEDKRYEIDDYFNVIEGLNTNIKTIFLMSDDYNALEEMKLKMKNFKIITLVDQKQNGYEQEEFERSKSKKIKEDTIKFISEIEIARNSTFFLGSYKSNVFRLIEYFKIEGCIDISKSNLSI